ncbi:hypothetical protein FEFB_14800 [Fructobacillus sp. EFB-N1]|uniref:hypothetical protein n=1 Tax=Fructobacillus sp. EFB-N1 TaxID=1658766 RepID=UPI00064DF8AF|nr:hypothetical protein [Fructobacillus sp. EFB-N1]KMK52779.1 hypothetical protein FEFB_14800 [Fructobacillus sp. EFB-N1]
MNAATKVSLYVKSKGTQDPRNPHKKSDDELVSEVTVNVTNLSAAKSYREYGVVSYGEKVIRSVGTLPYFDYCLIDGKKYEVQERQTVGIRSSIRLKEG